MTSLQTKKGGTGGKEEDRQTILKQMKVRTKLKTDKSWIHQDSEDDKEKVTSPISPQLKALEGRKFMWSSTTQDSEPDNNSGTFTAKETISRTSSSPVQSSNRNSGVFTSKEIVTSSSSPPAQSSNRNSGVFTAKEIVTSSPSPTVQSSNKQFSYSSTDINTSSTGSKTSPPPSTSGNRPANSYIIRGQPVNAVSQVKTPTFFNGYQKSQVQARTTSLPRVPTATGYKMSTDEYKKLAPYNVRNKSSDLSDDETPFTQQEQAKRTEQASSVLRNTTSKDRSYVISAAKRNSGIGTQDSGNPFLAKRIEIKDDEVDTSSKSQTLPKTLPSYSAEDANRVTERSSSPRMTSYSMTSSVDEKSSSLHPEAGKITIVRGESHNEGKDVSKPATQKESSTSIQTTRTESVPERSSSPRLTSYSMSSSATGRSSSVKPEVGKITVLREDSHTDSKDVSKPPTEKESSTTTRTDRVEVRDKKDEAQPTSLDAFLIEDANRFQSNWKANQNVQPTSQTSPARVEVRDKKKDEARLNSLDSYLFEDASRFENKWKTNQTVQPTVQTSPAKVEVGDKKDETGLKSLDSFLYSDPSRVEVKDKKKDEARLNSLDSYLFEDASRFENNFKANQSKPTTLQTSPARAPGRPESPKLTSWNTDSGYSTIRPEPGKITVLRQESEKMTPKPTENKTSTRTVTTNVESGSVDIPKLTSFADITEKGSSSIQAGPGKITVLRQESNQLPEVTSSTRTVETKAESTSPAPAPRLETKPKDTTSEKYTDLISWTDLDSSTENRHPTEKPAITPTPVPRNTNKDRPTQPSRSPEARHRVSESLDDPQLIHSRNQIPSSSENQNVKISIETLSDDPNVPPKIERVSSPRITSNSENRNVKISIETLPEQPQTTETHNTERSSSPRPTPRTREGTMNTTVSETRYRVPENLEDTMPQPSSNRSSSRTTVTTTTSRSTDPVYTEYLEDNNSRTTRTVSNSRDTYTTTTVETRYDDSSYGNASQYDPQSPSNKGVLFVKEYVNSRESLKSPTTAGSLPDYSGDSEMLSYSNNSSYLYSSAPRRADEGPCTYCGREIKDCAKIMLDHLNIYCHEYCFKCGICHKPMGDLVDSIFIHRDVVHCESCYEKLF